MKTLPETKSAKRPFMEVSGGKNSGGYARHSAKSSPNPQPALNWLVGGGEMGERIRHFDWSQTELGPMENWSLALRTTLRIMLASAFPHILWWGPHYVQFYNDSYRPVLGAKHPDRALGRRGSQCWDEIWPIIGPLVDKPFHGGPPTWAEDILLEVRRHGFGEETHFTIAYSPVPDDTVPGGIGGVLATVHEITGKVVGDRRVVVLRDLSARSSEARTVDDACAIAAKTLANHPKDFPFALLYLIDADQKEARLASAANDGNYQYGKPLTVSLDPGHPASWPWPFESVLQTETMQVVTGLAERFSGHVPHGPWSDPPESAAVVPIPSNKAHRLAGFLVAGISSRIQLDDSYRDFLGLVSSQIATAIVNAREYEEERKRAEALAEIDRAKTAFFSNVSHEFRTPLTLMLGPLEEMLKADAFLPAEERGRLTVIHRNSLRLLKLVNSLLDFSRIEAGRIQANFEPVDLAAFTTDLASAFRSAMHKAGLQFIVECSPMPENVFVDRDMWEKIIFNLLSNAFKFTFDGSVTVSLCAEASHAVLRVADTGTGIPDEELPNVFKRFHRVQNARGRTHEGTGIGLALVHELVKLHGGSISVESKSGKGTTFTVLIPLGRHHLPAGRIGTARQQASTALRGDVFVEEALHWMPERLGEPDTETLRRMQTETPRARILVADDNSDMRDYVSRLLRGCYDLALAEDGEQALKSAREQKPDLILSDIMMPRMDGFEFLKAIRNDANLKTVPVILLSARAGDEARVEGIEHGADDYLVKPFTGRELLARVATHIKLARIRAEVEDALRKAQDELIQMNKDLERRIEERTASLREAVAQMEEFSYSVSHDLRSPVRAMYGYAKAVLEDFGDKLDVRGKEYLERILQSGARMDRLINDVLTYTRVSRRETPLALVSLDRLVRDIVAQNPAFAPDHAHVCVQGSLPDVIGHEPSLSQVISNLLHNAVKFVVPGVKPHVMVHSQLSEGRVRLWIEDNGIGIKPQHQGRLFGMFERLHPEGKYEGTGIGLAIVRKATERMGGQAGVVSDGVHGSHFWIELPAA